MLKANGTIYDILNDEKSKAVFDIVIDYKTNRFIVTANGTGYALPLEDIEKYFDMIRAANKVKQGIEKGC